MKKTTTTTERTKTATMYEQAEKAVYIALRARHEKSGLKFLAELQNAQTQDKQARTAPQIAEQIEELQKAHDNHTEQAAFFESQSKRVTLTAEERATAHTLADELRTKAHNEQQHVNALYDTLDITYSDRADLTQTAVIKMLELEREPAPISQNVLAVYGVETAEELTDTERAEAQATANFRAVINAVGKAINQLASPEALNRTTTKAEPITAEEVAEYIRIYGDIGKDVKISANRKRTRASDCYITIEERHTKTQNGYYKITHYKTTAPYQYIEDYTEDENGESDAQYLKIYNPFVSNYSDIERIEELCKNANLTDRQKLFLEHFARRCRVSADFKDCKDYAFKQIGITTDTNKSTFFNRLKKALTK